MTPAMVDAGVHPAASFFAEAQAVYAWYSALPQRAHAAADAEPAAELGLGGKLLWAGALDDDGCRIVRAANVAGAASLSAASDPDAHRRAIREGVADFLVTSLDEALRILKNEIRKKNPVAVCVGIPATQLAAEMLDRGVLPDLVRGQDAIPGAQRFQQQRARVVEPASSQDALVCAATLQSGAAFEAAALDLLPAEAAADRRWLRLAPRYMGPQWRRWRSVFCSRAVAAELKTRIASVEISS